MSRLPVPNMKKYILNFFDENGEEILVFQAEIEAQLLYTASELLEVADVDYPIDLAEFASNRITVRSEELKDGIFAFVGDEFPKFYAKKYAEAVGEPTPADVAAHANLDSDEWQNRIEYWHDEYPDDVREDEARQTADVHLRNRFGIPIDEFEREIVFWDDAENIRRKVGRFFGGDTPEADRIVFVGLETANDALETVRQELAEE